MATETIGISKTEAEYLQTSITLPPPTPTMASYFLGFRVSANALASANEFPGEI